MSTRTETIIEDIVSNKKSIDQLYSYLAPILFIVVGNYYLIPLLISNFTVNDLLQKPEMAMTLPKNQPAVVEAPAPVVVAPKVEPKAKPTTTVNHKTFNMMAGQLTQKFASSQYMLDFKTQVTDRGLIIDFNTRKVFFSGKAGIKEGAYQEISSLARFFKLRYPNYQIQIEGYTDNIPVIKNRRFFPTNWELTGARAAGILKTFERAGYNSDQLIFSGHGSSKARYSNLDQNGKPIEKNQRLNRRIQIIVTEI